MWKQIKFLTKTKHSSSLQAVDIPYESLIDWNNIKGRKDLKFKIIYNPDHINAIISTRKSHYLSQVQESPFTVKLMSTILGNNSHTTVGDELLNGTVDLTWLQLASTTEQYLLNLKRNKEIIKST